MRAESEGEEGAGGRLRWRWSSHVGQLKDDIRKEGGGGKRGQLPDIPQSVGRCGCWCQGQ